MNATRTIVVVMTTLSLGIVSSGKADVPIVATQYTESNHWVVYTPGSGGYLVGYAVWGIHPAIPPALFVSTVDSNGARYGSTHWILNDIFHRSDAVWNPAQNEVFVVATLSPLFDSHSVSGLRVQADGTPIGTEFPVFAGTPAAQQSSQVRVAYNSLADEYLVVAAMASSPSSTVAMAQRVSAQGALLGGPNLLTDPHDQSFRSLALAYAPISDAMTPQGRYLFIYARDHRYKYGLRVNFLDSTGNTIMETNEWGSLRPWEVPVDWEGTLDDGFPSFNCIPSHVYNPDVAYREHGTNRQFLVVWDDHDNDSHWGESAGIWSYAIDADRIDFRQCGSLYPYSEFEGPLIWEVQAYTNFRSPRVTSNPLDQSYLIAWREIPTSYSGNSTTHFHARARASSSPRFNDVLSQTSGDWPGIENPRRVAVAAGADGKYLITWEDSRNESSGNSTDIYGALYVPPVSDTRPPNDDCADAIEVWQGQTRGTLLGATPDGASSCDGNEQHEDVWYTYQAPQDGTLYVTTCGTHDMEDTDGGIDTLLSLHAGCPGTTNNQLICNDDWPSGNVLGGCEGLDSSSLRDSAVALDMLAGQSVWIRVSRFSGAGSPLEFLLNVDFMCADDAYESGSGLYGSYDLTGHQRTWLSTLAGPGVMNDRSDWYAVQVAPGDTHLVVTCLFSHAEGDINLTLMNGNTQIWSVARSLTDNEVIEARGLPPDTYYLGVDLESGPGCSTYDLWWESSCGDDSYEENDTWQTAYDLSPYPGTRLSEHRGLGVATDDDYYTVVLDPWQNLLSITCFFAHAAADIDVQLLNEDATFTVAIAQSATDHEILEADVEPGGTYRIYVYRFSGSGDPCTTYDLVWHASAGCSQTDAYEENNTRETAYPLDQHEQVWLSDLAGLAIVSDDDWYRVEANPGFEMLSITCRFLHAEADIDMVLTDSTGQTLQGAYSVTDNESILLAVSPGVYYVRVYRYSGDPCATYDLWWDDVSGTGPQGLLAGTIYDIQRQGDRVQLWMKDLNIGEEVFIDRYNTESNLWQEVDGFFPPESHSQWGEFFHDTWINTFYRLRAVR